MSYQEKEKALRIMEALSEVDETLLARCEDSGKKVIPFWRYGRVMAACVAGAVVVVGFLAVSQGVLWNGVLSKNETAAQDAATTGNSMMNADSAMPEADVNEGLSDGYSGAEMENAMDNANEPQEAGRSDASDITDISGALNALESTSITGAQNQQNSTAGAEATKENADQEVSDACGLPVDTSEQLTLEEARAVETVGAYIPQMIPDGYVLESARGNVPEEVIVVWSKGMDTIRVSVTDQYALAENEKLLENRLVDVDEPETYDVHLYEIPYGETVPAEYRECFNQPIFRAADMTKEIVEARMKVVADAGDTDTPRGNFAVLYENGILVEFNADASSDEIWKMYLSIQQ